MKGHHAKDRDAKGLALLTTTELRLVDLLLASGGIPVTPAAVRRDLFAEDGEGNGDEDDEERPPDPTRRRPLRSRVAAVEATGREVAGIREYGSVDELSRIRRQSPNGVDHGADST